VVDQKNRWTEALQKRSFVVQLILVTIFILITVSGLPYFFHAIIGPKPGIIINDPVLNAFAPRDNSWLIFGLIYLSLGITLQGIYNKPEMILLGLKCYLLITVLRIFSMYVITLEAPEGIIPLHDPIVDLIAYGGNVFNKDLFFSGHVATLTLFALLEERVIQKRILVISVVLVAGLILLQRVHYSIDVLVAPMVTILLFQVMKRYFTAPINDDY
jgi:PAP2 superfamily C-terminal